MKVLYLVPHLPNPTKARSFLHIRGLLDAGHDVTVGTFLHGEGERESLSRLEAMGVKALWTYLSRRERGTNSLSALLSSLPMQAKFAWSARFKKLVDTSVRDTPLDIIHVEHLRMAQYGLSFLERYPVVWDAVDHLSSLYEHAAHASASPVWRLISRIEAPRLKSYEAYLVSQFPKTLVITRRDQELFQVASTEYANRVEVALMGMPLQNLPEVKRSGNTLIFTGTLNYDPNVASALYFVREIFPAVLRELPGTKLQLVGANPTPVIQALQGPNIEVTGFVPSVAEYLHRATLAVAPMLYGSGIQIKVLEAFAAKTPLVATSVALRGLDVAHNGQVWIANTPTDFTNAVIALLKDPARCATLAEAGRHYVEENYDLRKTTADLIEIYKDTIRLGPGRAKYR